MDPPSFSVPPLPPLITLTPPDALPFSMTHHLITLRGGTNNTNHPLPLDRSVHLRSPRLLYLFCLTLLVALLSL